VGSPIKISRVRERRLDGVQLPFLRWRMGRSEALLRIGTKRVCRYAYEFLSLAFTFELRRLLSCTDVALIFSWDGHLFDAMMIQDGMRTC
jgi:hypothetical protein